MIVDLAFFALSPRLYMSMPQPTEQYGQVLRVSVARSSLKLRISASASVAEKPSIARLELPRLALCTLSRTCSAATACHIGQCDFRQQPKADADVIAAFSAKTSL